MLTEHEKFRMIDESQKNDFFIEVNWEENNEELNNCKILKVTFPDGTISYLQRKYLLEVLFAIGKAEDQQKMIPQTLETIHHYKTVLGIKAKNDIHKGEMINFPIELSVPCSALKQEVIDKLPKEYKKGINNGVPLIKS